jgi:S1-C subfamily serine protease
MFSGFFLIHYTLTKTYSQQLNELNIQLTGKTTAIEETIELEKVQSSKERLILQEQMLQNFQKLEQNINKETSKIKLDLESQLKNVSSKFDERSLELDSKISVLKVQSSDFSSVIDDVIKGVVSIKTNKGSGSGVIFDQGGYLMTNLHVVDDVSSITVTNFEGQRSLASIIGISKDVDLAILKIDDLFSFNALKFARDEDVKVGSKVIAVGNPLGLSFTVTEGIISSKNRLIDGQIFLQTDVSVNPGNSGGPLINSAKRIVGINTFKLSNTQGLGFAIPSSTAQSMVQQVLG